MGENASLIGTCGSVAESSGKKNLEQRTKGELEDPSNGPGVPAAMGFNEDRK